MSPEILAALRYPVGKFSFPENIDQQQLHQWIDDISNCPFQIESAVESLTASQLSYIYRPEGWNIRQVVHHCADSHMNSLIRFKLSLTENTPTVKPYDEAAWAKLPDTQEHDIQDSISILKGVHARWTHLLKSMSEDDFQKSFRNPENNKLYSLGVATALYAWHGKHHTAHIHQALEHKGSFS